MSWTELLATAVPAIPSWRTEPSWPVDLPRFADPARPAEAVPAGCVPRDRTGCGTGFADDGELDAPVGGLALAGFADDAHRLLSRVGDDALIGVIRAWRRLSSWATARELAAVTELAPRRPADGTPPGAPDGLPARLSEFIPDEVAAALTLTWHAADAEVNLALDLAGPLAATAAALAGGRIDPPKAKLIAAATATLTPAHAAAVQAAVLPDAPDLTTGQLRRVLARAVLAADPQAARRQREAAEREARVDCWPDPAGTATLAGRNLPTAETLAADKRLCRIAKDWKKQGAAGGLDLLRARTYLALLLGQDITTPPADLLPLGAGQDHAPGADSDGPDPAGPRAGDEQQISAGLRLAEGLPPLAGSVNLTIPLTTLLGLSDAPGVTAGFGPLDPGTARALTCAAAGHRSTRWHITVTGPSGRALGYGTSKVAKAAADGGTGWTVRVTAEPVAAEHCDHRNREPGYRPSPTLQRLIRARSSTCSYQGCGRPAAACDVDHTIPHDKGGITCECNLAPT